MSKVVIASQFSSRQEMLLAVVATMRSTQAVVCDVDVMSIASTIDDAKPNALIIDMLLPNIEHQRTIRWIRTYHPTVAILAVTTSTRQTLMAIASGADRAVLHNTPVNDMVEAMEYVLGRSNSGAT